MEWNIKNGNVEKKKLTIHFQSFMICERIEEKSLGFKIKCRNTNYANSVIRFHT